MASANTDIIAFNRAGLADFLQKYSESYQGNFSITLAAEVGQGYSMVLQGNNDAALQIALISAPAGKEPVILGAWGVRDCVEELFADGQTFSREVEQIVDQVLLAPYGYVKLTVRDGRVVDARFVPADIGPQPTDSEVTNG
jgi:hypothetical protein